MADGGQRLLDVIDDPNALESFLGGLTADTELLPSAETVDNVVASLARSLDDNEYEVDSPNETLFDTLDSSSNHLTDISRSYVPSDFGHGSVHTDGFGNSLEGYSNGNNVIRGGIGQHEQQTQVQTPGCEQFIGSSSNNNNSTIINSVISASSVNTTNNTTVTGSTLKQIIASSVPNCDPSKSTPNYVQTGQLQLNQNSTSNNLSFPFASQDLQKHNIEVSHNQLNQVTSLSSVSLEGQIQQQNVPSNSTNNLISVVGAGHENGSGSTLTNSNSTSFRVVATQQSGQKIVAASNVSQSISAAGSVQVTSGAASGVCNTVISSGASTIASSNVTLSTTTNVVGSNLASIQQQQQYIANTSTHQLMSGQTVSIPSMTVSAPQLIANSQGGLVASAGQNILQQIQSAGGGQSYIAMEQPTALIATGPSTFGTNVALLATGGTPTYAVLPTTQQFLTNAIIPQPTIQTLTKAANGAYFQTTGTPQIVATSSVNALQNVGTAVTTSNTTTPPVTSVSSSTEANNGGTGLTSQQTLPTSSASTVTDGVMTQLIQQSQQQITNVSGNTGTVAITPQQSFAIGNAAGIGQVVVSQVGSLSTMTTPQQTQLSGTIVLNQYGQPMLLPSASTAQAGLQLILRQQPNPQVLTIQTPTGTAALNAQGTAQATTASGKPIVRYVSQMQQVAQTSGYGIQQIQTANGPTWVAVRYPQVSQASQFSQIQTDSIINATAALQNQISTNAQSQLQLQSQQQSQQVQIHLQQQQQQAQQLIQQTQQQQQQIQLQGGLAQASLSVQQQVQNTNQLQMQQAQQQLSMQSQVQLQNHQGQISSNLQQQQVQSQQTHNVQQTMSQSPMPMETQNLPTPTQTNQFINRPNKTLMHQSVNNSPQTQPSRDFEQQQISVPDSSSEPPPPKKAKTKSKSSKKKVTLDLEQLLKQSGIMDEDLQDDMSFDFGFGSMIDMQPNGLPLSPQVPPPAQIPVINTTEPPKKASKKKSNSKKSQAQPPPPPPVVLPPPPVTTPSPSAKTKKKSPPKKKNAPPPPSTPPPPLPPPPPIVTPTKSKSSKKKSSNSSGNVNENQKSEPKTASSKKTVPPKKVSSLDTLLATIDAVAAAAGASYSQSPPQSSPSSLPPPSQPTNQPTTPSRKPTPSPKSKSKSKSKAAKNSAPTTPAPKMDNFLPSVPTSTTMTFPVPSSTPSHSMMPTSSLPSPQTQSSLPTAVVAPTINTSTAAPPPAISPVIPTSRVTGANLTNGSTSVTTSQTGLTRVVQTIQLTPQNQQLLRNIQGEIQRLCNIPQRNESEQAALQKLVVLQQQVIATGTPVPNPTHLNNLAQIVNVESISLATPSATVPSSDTASASSCSTNAHLVSPCESDLTPSPVSSTVVATTTMSVLANANLINSSSKLISSKLSGNSGSSPVVATTTAGGGGSSSSNGACIIVGSPSVSSTASPDSTSNLASNLNIEQCSVLPSTSTTSATNNPTPNVNSGGLGSVVVSNVKADLGQLVASLSVPPSEDKTKDNTQMKGFQGVTTSTSTSVPVPTQSSVSFSQHLQHVPPPTNSYAPPTFSTRSVLDEKKAEEQRLSNLKAEEEKRARWKKEEFEMLLQRDQQYVVKPDYEIPFNSKKDAVERLMKYHIYRDRNDMNFEEFDTEFGNNAGILLEKFSVMMSKYRNLLLKESTKEVGCAERVMLERMFVSEEKVRLDQDRMLVAQGDVLELPLPPDSWLPKIKEMVDKEMMEFEPQDPVVSQQVQSAVDSIIGCGNTDTNSYLLEEGDKIEYDAFGVPINSSGYAGVAASSADIDEAVRSILT